MNGSPLADVALMYGILAGVNIPAALIGLDFREPGPRDRLWFEPPGYVIPIAWFVLFTMLGIARYELGQSDPAASMSGPIIGLAVLCATYAYYTLGLSRLTGVSALWYGLAGNLIVILVALVVACAIWPVSTTASLLILPIAVWTSYATAIVVGELRARGLA